MPGFNLLLAGLVLVSALCAMAEESALEITADTRLDPAKTYSRIIIKSSNITVDGQGAWVIGATDGNAERLQGNWRSRRRACRR